MRGGQSAQMIDRQAGPLEVLANTLRNQAVPNTFRSAAGPGTVDKPRINRGGGNAGPLGHVARLQLRVWVYVAFTLLVVFVWLFVLSGTQ